MEIDIPFGAKDSELKEWRYTIPEGYTAEIKDGEVIVKSTESEDERIRKDIVAHFNFKKKNKDVAKLCSNEWSEEDEKWFEEIELMVLYFTDDEKYREKFISWLKSLKNRGNFPKSNTNSPSWSEEDEEMIGDIISSLRGYMCLASKSPYYTNHETHIQKEIEFLNALRPHWKPSEEQMEALESAVKLYKDTHFEIHHKKIVSLYEQLKKLM